MADLQLVLQAGWVANEYLAGNWQICDKLFEWVIANFHSLGHNKKYHCFSGNCTCQFPQDRLVLQARPFPFPTAAPIANQIQVMEAIGAVEQKGSGLWAALFEQAWIDGTKVTDKNK